MIKELSAEWIKSRVKLNEKIFDEIWSFMIKYHIPFIEVLFWSISNLICSWKFKKSDTLIIKILFCSFLNYDLKSWMRVVDCSQLDWIYSSPFFIALVKLLNDLYFIFTEYDLHKSRVHKVKRVQKLMKRDHTFCPEEKLLNTNIHVLNIRVLSLKLCYFLHWFQNTVNVESILVWCFDEWMKFVLDNQLIKRAKVINVYSSLRLTSSFWLNVEQKAKSFYE